MTVPERIAYKELTLQQLRSFVEVCRHGGYAPAARVLLVSGPAVWEQVRALERHFGLRLFQRVGRAVQPTRDGEHLLELVRPLLAGFESIEDAFHQETGALPKSITLVTNLRVLAYEISEALRAFQRRFPSVKLRIHYTGSAEFARVLLQGDADVSITLKPLPDETWTQTLAYEPLGAIQYLLVLPRRHALAKKRDLSLKDIVGYPLVLADAQAYSRHRVQEILHRFDLLDSLSVAVESNSDEYTLACVRAGMGIGITIGTPSSPLCRGMAVRSLRRWFGLARIGFMRREGVGTPRLHRELEQTIRAYFVHMARKE